MDKFEALRSKKKVLDTRRYGDISELMALLKHVGATALKLDVTHKTHHIFLPSMTPIASLEQIPYTGMNRLINTIVRLPLWIQARFGQHGQQFSMRFETWCRSLSLCML